MKKLALLSFIMVFMVSSLTGCSKNKPAEVEKTAPVVQKTQDVGISIDVNPEKEEESKNVGVNIKVENGSN